jgi:hypothetical protein
MIRKSTQVFTATQQAATVDGLLKAVMLSVALTGTWTSLTVTFEGTLDGTNWFPVALVPAATQVEAGLVTTATAAGAWVTRVPVSVAAFRARCSTFASGTAPTATVRAAAV